MLRYCVRSLFISVKSRSSCSTLDRIEKIGEGVYGEVFLSPKGHVIKIFPVDGDIHVNGEKQMTFADVYPEVFVSKYTSLFSIPFIALFTESLANWPICIDRTDRSILLN